MAENGNSIQILGESVPQEYQASNVIDEYSLDDASAFTEYLELYPEWQTLPRDPTLEATRRWRAAVHGEFILHAAIGV